MKRFISLMLVVLLAITMGTALGGCGIESTIEEPTTGTVTELGENPTDDEINAFITQKSENPDKIVLRYASTSPDLNGQSYLRGCREFLMVVKQELGDKVEIQYFMNGTFGGSADAIVGGLQNGNFEITDWPLASLAEFTNAFQPLDVPYLLGGLEETVEFCEGPAGDVMREKLIADTDVNLLFYGLVGMRQMTNSKKEITSPADMKGLKIRVQNNPLHIAGMEALGCAPTGIAFSELFTSLQQKTIDGQENPIETIYNFKFYEAQSYLTITNHLGAVGGILISNDFYNDLDDDTKAAFDKASKAASDYIVEDINESTEALLAELEGLMTVTRLTDEQVAVFKDQAKTAWPEMKEIIGEDYFDEVLAAGGIAQ